jgi:lipoprotein Spr
MIIVRIILAVLVAVIISGAAAPAASAGAANSNRESVEQLLIETTKRVKRLPGRRRTGAKKALNLVQTSSEDLCRLTGLEYTPVGELLDSVQQSIAEDGEDLTDESGVQEGIIGDEGEDLADFESEEGAVADDIDIESFRSLWLSYVDEGGDDITEAGVEKQELVNVVLDWLGTRYRFGGVTRRGIDCSAFTRMVYRETAGIELPRTARIQATVGSELDNIEDLQFGDLVLFHTRSYARVTHIGVYLGDNLFAHASSRYGVTISSLESGYYNRRFVGGVRLSQHDVAQMAIDTQDDEVDS